MGVWASADGHVKIHHARLAISDLRTVAKQPITDEESGLTIAFVGEIYNHLELRGTMAGPFRTDSDTETLLRLFRNGITTSVPQLRGMFAIALVDERHQRVVLMRDPLGKKPLFILRRPEGTYFGSSVLAIAAAAHHTKVDDDVAAQWWELGFTPPTTSLLSGCVPLLPGQVIELDWSGTPSTPKRILPPAEATITDITVPEAIQRLDELVRRAVRRRLSDNPNPVALLSGGIDSTVVCKYAIEAGTTRLLTLGSRTFKAADEVYAHEAARKLGVPLEVVMMGNDPMGDLVASNVHLHDEPLGMISFIPLASLARMACTSSRVLLTGDGGDEVFCGYGRPEDWVATDTTTRPDPDYPSGPALPPWMSVYGRRAAGFDLVGHGFCKLDRATAEQAIEARCPLLSWDILSFVRSLPKDVLLFKPVAKPLLKALLKDWPESFIERPKAGFPFRLRGIWGLSFYAGLREGVDTEAIARFAHHLPEGLKGDPNGWSTIAIARNFPIAYKLYVWSAFFRKLNLTTFTLEPPSRMVKKTTAASNDQTHSDDWVARFKYLGHCAARQLTDPAPACPACGGRELSLIQRKFIVTTLHRCRSCQLMFRVPLDTATAAKQFYTTEVYDAGITTEMPDRATLAEMKRTQFRGTPKDASDRLGLLAALGCDPKQTHILDYGCSWGYTAWQFQEAGYRVTGYELGRARCDFAVSQMGITAYQREQDLSGPYDVFFCSHVLEHVPSVRETLRLARSLVRPGGWIIIFTPNGSSAHQHTDPTGWRKMWGQVHPNLLDDQYYLANEDSHPLLLTSEPYNIEAIRAWAAKPAHRHILHPLTGGELMAILHT